MLSRLPARYYPLLLALVFLLGIALTYRHETLGCSRCDTTTYLAMGRAFAERGLLVDTPDSKGRLYGYPVVIAGLVKLAAATGIPLGIAIAGLQTGFYLALAIWLSRLCRQTISHRAGLIVLAALLLNILAWPYLTLPLTDWFSLLLEIALAGVLAELFLRPRLVQSTAWLFALSLLLGLLFGFAVMVRPANIQFAGFIAPALLGIYLHHTPRRWCRLPLMATGAGVGFAAAVAPQLWFNWYYHDQLTFMPVYKLGAYQMLAGRNMLKYGTAYVNGGMSIEYMNPWRQLGQPASSNFAWYFINPLYGAKTILGHFFAALDFDYYFPYNKLKRSGGEFWSVLACQLAVYWGASGWVGGAARVWRAGGWNETRRRWLFPTVLSAAMVISWGAVYAFSAVESRFGLPLLALAMPWAVWSLAAPRPVKLHLKLWLGFALWLAVAWHYNNLLNGLNGLPR